MLFWAGRDVSGLPAKPAKNDCTPCQFIQSSPLFLAGCGFSHCRAGVIICTVFGEISYPRGVWGGRGWGSLPAYEPGTSLTVCHEAESVRVHASIVRSKWEIICNRKLTTENRGQKSRARTLMRKYGCGFRRCLCVIMRRARGLYA